jgi:hypothetical protein
MTVASTSVMPMDDSSASAFQELSSPDGAM